MRRSLLVRFACAALMLASARAHAHLATTGLGPVYDGVLHLFLSVDDLLPVLAMALLAGSNGPTSARWAVFALPSAWLAGGVAGIHGGLAGLPLGLVSPWLPLLLLGLLVAIDVRLAPPVVLTIAVLLGVLHGGANGTDIAAAGREAGGLIGIAAAIFVVSALATAAVVSLRRPWARIVVRVAGSWTGAIGLLLWGWSLAGRA